jgi:hypothetical protein
VEGEAHLLEVVLRLGARSRFTDLLDSGQEQADEDRDNGNHYEQLNQGEAVTSNEFASH